MPVRYHGQQACHVPASLAQCSYVYVRVDALRAPLCRPYEGPFKVLEPGPKTFKLERAGKPWIVSIDRLKAVPRPPTHPPFASASPPGSPASGRFSPLPCHAPAAPAGEDVVDDGDVFDVGDAADDPFAQAAPELPVSPVPAPAPASPYRTRVGRVVRPPDRLVLPVFANGNF